MRSLLLLLTLTALPLRAADFLNLTPEAHLAGPTVAPEAAEGKVVLVTDFGFRCPLCRMCLPKVAGFAGSLARDPRFLALGAHVQQRDEAAVKALMRETGATDLPVYQFLRAEGAPTSLSLPFAYVLDHTGETVWSGNPAQDPGGMEAAVREALKRAPIPVPGSLIPGIDVLYNRDMPRLLVAGKNIERHLKTLRARAAKADDRGREAAALAELCELWAEARCAAIDADLKAYPSRALAAMEELNDTMPSATGRYRETYRTLMKDRRTATLAGIRQAAAKLAHLSGDPRRRTASAKTLMRKLDTLAQDGSDADTADVRALVGAYLE